MKAQTKKPPKLEQCPICRTTDQEALRHGNGKKCIRCIKLPPNLREGDCCAHCPNFDYYNNFCQKYPDMEYIDCHQVCNDFPKE